MSKDSTGGLLRAVSQVLNDVFLLGWIATGNTEKNKANSHLQK